MSKKSDVPWTLGSSSDVRMDREQLEYVAALQMSVEIVRETFGEVVPEVVFELLDRDVAELDAAGRVSLIKDLKMALEVSTGVFGPAGRTPDTFLNVYDGLFALDDDDDVDDEETY